MRIWSIQPSVSVTRIRNSIWSPVISPASSFVGRASNGIVIAIM